MFAKSDYRFGPKCRWLAVALLVAIALPAAAAQAAPTALTPAQSQSSWLVDMTRFNQGAHARLTCQDCHGQMPGHGQMRPADTAALQRPATEAFDYSACKRCHAVAFDRHLAGGHAKAMVAQKAAAKPAAKPAPTCGHCHNAHYDKAHQERVQIGRQQVETCGTCHPAHAASYGADIHGRLAVDMATRAAAFCTDCHGAHDVTDLKQPEQAAAACRRCHSEASAAFAGYVVHAGVMADTPPAKEPGPKDNSLVWLDRLQLAMMTVVGLSLLFFVVQAGMWVLREIHERVGR